MKHYDSFENIKYDGTLLGEEIWAFNKLDAQNFCARFSMKNKEFNMFGSKTQNVDGLDVPEIIYCGKLTNEFIKEIQETYWTYGGKYQNVKEGVVCKHSTLMKGQRRPQVKIKTKWWMNKLTEVYPDRWKELE